jgi:hypothetical protein
VRFDFVIHREEPGRAEQGDDHDSQNDPTRHDKFLFQPPWETNIPQVDTRKKPSNNTEIGNSGLCH